MMACHECGDIFRRQSKLDEHLEWHDEFRRQMDEVNDPSPPAKSSYRKVPNMTDAVKMAIEALRPFANCAEQIAPDEDGEEWAKFRLLIGDYRRAAEAVATLSNLADDAPMNRSEAIKEVVGICNRIPGTTHWNAAEFMYDLLTKGKIHD